MTELLEAKKFILCIIKIANKCNPQLNISADIYLKKLDEAALTNHKQPEYIRSLKDVIDYTYSSLRNLIRFEEPDEEVVYTRVAPLTPLLNVLN